MGGTEESLAIFTILSQTPRATVCYSNDAFGGGRAPDHDRLLRAFGSKAAREGLMNVRQSSCLLVSGLALAVSCAQESMPLAGYGGGGREAGTDADARGTTADAAPSSTGTRPSGGPPASAQCPQALAEPLPARIAVMSASVQSGSPMGRTVTPQDIFDKLWPHCIKCHTAATPVGGYNVTDAGDLSNPSVEMGFGFKNKGEEALAHIRSDGKTQGARDEAMPPIDPTTGTEGIGWTARMSNSSDPLVLVASWLDLWIKAGSPASFVLPATPVTAGAGGEAGAPPSYLLSPAVGNGMTNIGNCVPDKALVATDDTAAAAIALDAKFASMQRIRGSTNSDPHQRAAEEIGLPVHLYETDITTFDGEALARMGVIAFVPQYPLWSDDAGKIRHVRVPRGQSIVFDKATQEFRIPQNTRFYKTFLKRIIDTDGNPSWRKIETRLIVARADTTDATGKIMQNALFGSYIWDDTETQATLIGTGYAQSYTFVRQGDTQLKEGDGFQDTILQIDTDVNLAARVRATSPDNSALQTAHAVRDYAIPSSTRCIQCHQGSPSQSFVLGFRPVQLWHRKRLPAVAPSVKADAGTDGGTAISCCTKAVALGEGGVIEPSGTDELTQLQRLVDYGVITGIDSLSDVLPLELSQGDRKPRNDLELLAQGYMLGNCAHCHNPRGFPSITFPQLKDVGLDFLPGPNGGIFQFPLEKVSPRITRGINGNVQLPYITPSLLDNPSVPTGTDPLIGDNDKAGIPTLWRPKWRVTEVGFTAGVPHFVYAPWRSLLYRNVDTPFVYADDFAIYPHMPMNTPGFDCRAKQIFADWMVGIPAARKRPEIDEYTNPFPDPGLSSSPATWPNVSDASEQPYVEVKPGAPGYQAAAAAAAERLNILHGGSRTGEIISGAFTSRYDSCPDTSDIVDPEVDSTCHPVPVEHEDPVINVPTHPHWVSLDLTQTTSTGWTPRRNDFAKVLQADDVNGGLDGGGGASAACGILDTDKKPNDQVVLDLLTGKIGPGVTIDQKTPAGQAIYDFVTTPQPMGLWTDKTACDWSKPPLSTIPTFAAVRSGSSPPPWTKTLADADAKRQIVDDNRRVYMQTPGAAVFGMICINCHGPNADSHGRLADNLANMTGGNAIVADLKDGLFGPAESPGAHRNSVFLPTTNPTPVSSDDWAVRYVAWMALGGTGVTIPPAYLTIIGHTPVFGETRAGLTPPKSANMLSVARDLCMASLSSYPYDFGHAGSGYFDFSHPEAGQLLFDNGDAKLWLRLCSINNPPPVRPYLVIDASKKPLLPDNPPNVTDPNSYIHNSPIDGKFLLRCAFQSGCGADGGAPSSFSVGDENLNVYDHLTDENLHPWCTYPGSGFVGYERWLQTTCIAGPHCDTIKGSCQGAFPDSGCVYPPRCPDTWKDLGNWDYHVADGTPTAALATERWASRGAINAGIAVFAYLDAFANGKVVWSDTTIHREPQPTYDHCEALLPLSGADAGAN